MCGIVGLFLKDKSLEPQLGAMLADMLARMGDRGPDSAGFAVYGETHNGLAKITVQSPFPAEDFAGLADRFRPLSARPRFRSTSGTRTPSSACRRNSWTRGARLCCPSIRGCA
jgi:hypothetical protein